MEVVPICAVLEIVGTCIIITGTSVLHHCTIYSGNIACSKVRSGEHVYWIKMPQKQAIYTKMFLENSWMESSPHKTVFQLIAWQEVMEMMNIYKYNTIFMKYTIVLSTCFGILNSPKSTCSQELLSTPRQTLPSWRPLEAKLLPLDLCAVIWASGIQRKLCRTPRLLLLQSKVARYVFEYTWNLERPHSTIYIIT